MKNILFIILILLTFKSLAQTNYYYTSIKDTVFEKHKLIIENKEYNDFSKMLFYKLSKKELKTLSVEEVWVTIFGIRRKGLNKGEYIKNKEIAEGIKDTAISLKEIYDTLFSKSKHIIYFIDNHRIQKQKEYLYSTEKHENDTTIWTLKTSDVSSTHFSTIDDFKHWYELIHLDIAKTNKNELIQNEFNKRLYHSIMIRYWEKTHPN